MDWHEYDAALFDLDGVLTPTAEVHMRAWRQLFTDFLTKRGVNQPYLDSDYFDYIDGKPRYDGVRALLASRGIQSAEGDPGDSPDLETVCGLGNRKNDSSRLCCARRASTVRRDQSSCLTISPSVAPRLRSSHRLENATAVLEAADLGPRFDVVVDGNVAAEKASVASRHRIPSSLLPTSLVYRCERAVVFEDAVSGVEAGHAGASAWLLVSIAESVRSD